MLDAYIIEKIKREQEQQRKSDRVPLQQEKPRPPERPRPGSWHEEDRRDSNRGVVIIDL